MAISAKAAWWKADVQPLHGPNGYDGYDGLPQATKEKRAAGRIISSRRLISLALQKFHHFSTPELLWMIDHAA